MFLKNPSFLKYVKTHLLDMLTQKLMNVCRVFFLEWGIYPKVYKSIFETSLRKLSCLCKWWRDLHSNFCFALCSLDLSQPPLGWPLHLIKYFTFLQAACTQFHQQLLTICLFPSGWLLKIFFGILSASILFTWLVHFNLFILIKDTKSRSTNMFSNTLLYLSLCMVSIFCCFKDPLRMSSPVLVTQKCNVHTFFTLLFLTVSLEIFALYTSNKSFYNLSLFQCSIVFNFFHRTSLHISIICFLFKNWEWRHLQIIYLQFNR